MNSLSSEKKLLLPKSPSKRLSFLRHKNLLIKKSKFDNEEFILL